MFKWPQVSYLVSVSASHLRSDRKPMGPAPGPSSRGWPLASSSLQGPRMTGPGFCVHNSQVRTRDIGISRSIYKKQALSSDWIKP